ncbi:hypothetical protein TWF730_003164 [Orbilia blumenaviensis]|uniref:DUF6314 domain-containing protein n=1 Tax=Orbilia blumenaviensis TaxID=1796055 RepID=A0AAV9U4R3_9PEZI
MVSLDQRSTMGSKTATVASRIFASLKGTWTLHRTLTSALPSFPSGTFTGSATFTPHDPTSSSSPDVDAPQHGLLYTESGELITSNGLTLRANKKYIYTYSPTDDKISAWFVKESRGGESQTSSNSNNTAEIDYLFHELIFGGGGDNDGNNNNSYAADGRLTAAGDHLCIKDNYSARYEFDIREGEVRSWLLRYNVKGPAKDYVSETRFER